MANSNFHVINLIIRKANDDKDLDPKKYEELFKEFAKSETSGKSSREKEAGMYFLKLYMSTCFYSQMKSCTSPIISHFNIIRPF